ncbi:hypothetical protein LC574_02485 [Nostoc sp. CHAB 5715]|nr:hypothetical protein [Nostoc sp. CHAB 5715]
MLDDIFMARINKVTGLDPGKLTAFQADLVLAAEHITAIIDETPSSFKRGPKDIPLSKRSDWLRRNVIGPADKLINALDHDAHFASYPEVHASALTKEERFAIKQNVERLRVFASDLSMDFEGRIFENASHNTEMRIEFCDMITDVLKKHAPHIPVSRGTYEQGQGNVGVFAGLLRDIYAEITGETSQLEQQLKQIVIMSR